MTDPQRALPLCCRAHWRRVGCVLSGTLQDFRGVTNHIVPSFWLKPFLWSLPFDVTVRCFLAHCVDIGGSTGAHGRGSVHALHSIPTHGSRTG